MDTQQPAEGTQSQQNQNPKPAEPQVIKEIHHHHYKHSSGAGNIFFGIIVLFIGLLFLGRNAGWFPQGMAFDWNWIWPLIIIFVGLSILSRHGWMSWVIGSVVTLIVIGFIAMLMFGNIGNANRAQITDSISIQKEATATSAELSIKTGAGNVTMSGGSPDVVSGTYVHQGFTLEKKSELASDIQRITLSISGSWNWMGAHRNDFNLALNNDIPYSLNFDTGATKMDIDLTTIMIKNVTVDTGASDVTMKLGDKVDMANVSISAGASSIRIELPKTVGAKLTLDSGVTSKTLPDLNKVDEKTYESANYSTATKKILLDLKLGAASLALSWR